MLSKLYQSDESTHDYTHSSAYELSKAKVHKRYTLHIFSRLYPIQVDIK